MTRNLLATALLALAVPAIVVGCQASASFGSSNPQTPSATAAPPPPPPPPPTASATETAPAPTATTPAPAATTPPATEAKPTLSGANVNLPGAIVFDTGKATFQAGTDYEKVLGQLKQFLDENPRITKLRIEGHTDNVGGATANEQLSGERALAIKRYLVEKGIPKTRLLAVGFGQSRPVADNATEEGRAKNRRTEFKIAELGGKPYVGRDPTGGGKVFDL